MPIVTEDACQPVVEQLHRCGDGELFAEAACKPLMDGANPLIIRASFYWTIDFINQQMLYEATMVMIHGILTYEMIRSQWEADELKATLRQPR